MTSKEFVEPRNATAFDTASKDVMHSTITPEESPGLEHAQYSGHFDDIIPQMFEGHEDSGSMLENLSMALGQFSESDLATLDHTWHL